MFNVCNIQAPDTPTMSQLFCFIGVGEAEWAFKITFNITEKESALRNVDLVFDGLDTFAKVTLVRIPLNCQENV